MSHKIDWTAEIQDAFETLLGLEENLTFEEIARRLTDQFGLPFSKNACVGRAHRMRLPPRPERPKVHRKLKGKTMPIRIDAPILPPEAQRAPNGHDLTIYQLHAGDCRYPSDEARPPYTYCGHPTESGLSYCPNHCKIVYHAPNKKWL
jgi:GcrA cell cycle regulator